MIPIKWSHGGSGEIQWVMNLEKDRQGEYTGNRGWRKIKGERQSNQSTLDNMYEIVEELNQ